MNTPPEVPHDAFGNPIDFSGKTKYGYVQNSSGHTTTFYGTPIKRTPKGFITIAVHKRFSALWMSNVELDGEPYKNSNVKPSMLIPVAL